MKKTRALFAATVIAPLVALACQQAPSQAPDVASTAAPDVTEVAVQPNILPNQENPADGIISGGQPTPEQLATARDAGYKTVINLRRPDEMGVGDEPEIVSGLGMDYVSLPVDGAAGLTRENVGEFAAALETAEYPVVLHCGSGNRIGAMFALKAFWLDGKSADEALQIGLDSGMTRLESEVRKILESEGG